MGSSLYYICAYSFRIRSNQRSTGGLRDYPGTSRRTIGNDGYLKTPSIVSVCLLFPGQPRGRRLAAISSTQESRKECSDMCRAISYERAAKTTK